MKTVFGQECCFIEIETNKKEFDEELWSPYLRHQGLILNISSWTELPGLSIAWKDSSDPAYAHPEIGILYVFGHAETKENIITFGDISDDQIAIKWSGTNDILWDFNYNTDVPFSLETKLQIKKA